MIPPNPIRDADVELSSQDRSVLRLLSEGATSKEISNTLGVSPTALAVSLVRVIEKLGIGKELEDSQTESMRHHFEYFWSSGQNYVYLNTPDTLNDKIKREYSEYISNKYNRDLRNYGSMLSTDASSLLQDISKFIPDNNLVHHPSFSSSDSIPLPIASAGIGLIVALFSGGLISSWLGLLGGVVVGFLLILTKAWSISTSSRSA